MDPDDIHLRVATRLQQMTPTNRDYFLRWLASYDPDGLERMLDKFEQSIPRPAGNSAP